VRAGAVTESGTKPAHRVVRANESIEPDDLLDPLRRADMVTRLAGIWTQLALAMQAMRQYRADHPQTTRHLEKALREIEQTLEYAPRSVRFDIGSAYFAYDRKPVWRPDRSPYDRVPHQLFADGLRQVQFKPGLPLAELRAFLEVLLHAANGFAADEDAVTALWDLRLTRIAHLAVDAFVETDDPGFDRARDELAAELGEVSDPDLYASRGGLAASQREAVERATALAIPEEVRRDLAARVEIGREEYAARQIASFPEAYREAERHGDVEALRAALDGYAAERVAVGDVDALFVSAAELAGAFEKREGAAAAARAEREIIAAMLPRTRFEALCQRLGELTVSPATSNALARALALSGDPTLYDAARAAYWSGSGALREALLPYLLESGAGHEGALGKIAREGEVDHAQRALKRLAELGTPLARAKLREAFESAHVELRIAAMTYLSDASADEVRAELTKLFEDPEPEVRMRAIGVVSKLGAVAAGPALVRRIQSPAFVSLPVDERKLLLRTLYELSPRRAEALAIEILGETRLITNNAAEETRALAAEVLGESSSREALTALINATKKRWLNTARVRDAAAAAAQAVGARLGVDVTKEGS
jgi:HEAT repeat protein